MKAHAKKAFALVCGAAVTMLTVVTLSVTVSGPADATQQFATSTGKPCGQCHQNPAGAGKLKPFGEKFKEKGNKL